MEASYKGSDTSWNLIRPASWKSEINHENLVLFYTQTCISHAFNWFLEARNHKNQLEIKMILKSRTWFQLVPDFLVSYLMQCNPDNWIDGSTDFIFSTILLKFSIVSVQWNIAYINKGRWTKFHSYHTAALYTICIPVHC